MNRAVAAIETVAAGNRPMSGPFYPDQLRDAKIEGQVVMEGRIGTDGFINSCRVRTRTGRRLSGALNR